MSSVYNLLREACNISQSEAAEQVHGTRLDTVKSWSSDRRPAPPWAINELQSLTRRIRQAGEDFASLIRKTSANGSVFIIGLAHDDEDARVLGFPSLAAVNQATAIAISLLPDDAEIRLVPRVRGAIAAPTLEQEAMIPTRADREVLSSMKFVSGKFYTAGNMNRRRYERLESIGWIKGLGVNVSDVEYWLTGAGNIQCALLNAAAQFEASPAPGGFQTRVRAAPRRTAWQKFQVGRQYHLSNTFFTVEKIEGEVITVKSAEGSIMMLSAPSVLVH